MKGEGLFGGGLRARAFEMGRCGSVVAARECECCGEVRPGSGTFREVRRTCNGRTCPYCGWVRATERVELLDHAARSMEEFEGYEWQMVTINPQYDMDIDSWDMSLDGLRSRALWIRKAVKALWGKLWKGPGAALFRATEISERGHVHVHAIYYGPRIHQGDSEKLAAEAYGRKVRIDVKKIKGGKEGVKKAVRYAAKSVKGSAAAFNEDFLTGERRARLLHPKLAAKWEVAAFNLRLSESYGAIRGMKAPAPDFEGGVHDDVDVRCSCGALGQYKTVYRNVFDYLIECHLQGKAGLEGNRWLPYWMREAVRRKKQKARAEQRAAAKARKAT